LTVSIVLIFTIAVGITGYLAFLNSQNVAYELTGELLNQITDRIEQHLEIYLHVPHSINLEIQDSITQGELNLTDNVRLKQHFQVLSYRFNTSTAICYGNEEDGNYTIVSSVGAPGVAVGTDRFWGFSDKATNNSFLEFKIDQNGQVLEKTLNLSNYDPRIRPWYKTAVLAGGPAWAPIYMWLEGVVSIDAVSPVYNEKNKLLGVLDTSLTLTGISDFLKGLHISEHGEAFIIDRSGLLIASSKISKPYVLDNSELVRLSALDCNNSVIKSTVEYLTQQNKNGLNETTNEQFSIDIQNERQFVEVTPYKDPYGLDWLIIVVIPESDFMGNVNKETQVSLFLIIISIICAIIICILLAHWITSPILSLNKSVKAYAEGDWTSRTYLNRQDELGELSESFNQMADQLEKNINSLRTSKEQYQNLFHSSADAILFFSDAKMIDINRSGEKMLSVSKDKCVGKSITDIIGNMGFDIGIIEKVVSSDIPEYHETVISRNLSGSGQFINVRISKVPSKEKNLKLVHMRDITEQRKAIISITEQESLCEFYSRIEMILQFLPDPTYVIDSNGYVLFWNKAIEQLTGLTSEEIKKSGELKSVDPFYKFGKPGLVSIALDPDLQSEAVYPNLEWSKDVVRASIWVEIQGEKRFLLLTATRLYDKSGQIDGAIESIRDITPRKLVEDSLIIANKKLNLLSSITRHDIQNKVTIVKSFVVLLEEFDMNSEQKSYIEAIKRSMLSIDHIIGFTKTYEELGLKVPVWQDVGESFDKAVKRVDYGDVVIHNEIRGISILVDPLFETVCYNLIENAIRHGKGLTKIEITTVETADNLIISVEDNGCGVSEDEKEMIFEKGYGKNTGFGLFLTREILEISGITISENGQEGSGCRFEIAVPKGKFRREID
jgi:PAS domain S-box-containing protein